MGKCSKCGNEIADDARFCPACGSPAGGEANTTAVHADDTLKRAYNEFQQFSTASIHRQPTYRNIALSVIFSLVTCGLYKLYWMFIINEEMNSLGNKNNYISGAMVIICSFLTCGIFGLYWSWKMGDICDETGKNSHHGVLFLILDILGLGLINLCIMQDHINENSQNRI